MGGNTSKIDQESIVESFVKSVIQSTQQSMLITQMSQSITINQS